MNQKDLPDVPAEVRDQLRFVLAETVDDVLSAALEAEPDCHAVEVRKVGRPK